MKIAIVDYGMGNIKSITSTLNFLGINEVLVTSNFDDLKNAEKLILPGVGSFAKAMSKIIENKIEKKLYELVKINKKPLLGICLGMQLLCNSSTEDGFTKGLALSGVMPPITQTGNVSWDFALLTIEAGVLTSYFLTREG